ncbi:DUF2336 domain-containing protein [Sphingomonas sp. G124]|uniref:DUF2336 domain-containing protein n=1 Tax=Sphingomonas cremea TaxID=2904799 RepID=A0A9X1U489_9SPHN|nr:DUF2336 domain-containing protein [Sphingomonas cremea]MCF2513956.1 DUF2336 domain-containing protein [Sphingomonas cremea]
MEWPLAASAADRQVEPARPRTGRGRLAVASADFFLDEASRLTDEERALMAAMLRGLVTDIADELISVLPPMLAAQAEQAREGLYRRLRRARLLEREGLVALLLRRADEQQLSARTDRREPTLSALVGDDDSQVAEAAMALVLARGRRRDRFGRAGLEFDDLAAEDAVATVYAVAAGLRDVLPAESDQPLAAAAQALLARHDEGRRLEASVIALARALEAAGQADETMIRKLAEDGDPALLVGLLARRAGIDYLDAWNFLTGNDAMMLARLAGCDRTTAAQILAGFEPMSGAHAADRIIDGFEAIDDVAVERCRRWMRLDVHYRSASDAMEQVRG